MIDLQFGWNLLPKQLEFVRSVADEAAYTGGFGSGKTVAGCVRTFLLANHIPGNKILVARRTYRELTDTTYRTFMEWLPKELYAGERKSDFVVYVQSRTGVPSEIIFRSLDNPDKFRSLDIGAFWIDEASETSEETFLFLKGRLRLSNAVNYRCGYVTTNPTDQTHWLYNRFVRDAHLRKDMKVELFESSTYDNQKNLPPGYIEELERTYPKDWIEKYLQGKFGFTVSGLPVFPGFVGDLHVQNPPYVFDSSLPLHRGWDFGVVRPACAIYQRDIAGRWHGLREVVGFNMGTRRFCHMVKEVCASEFGNAKWVDYCDPAGYQRSQVDERTSVEELNSQDVFPIRLPLTSPGQRAEIINRYLGMLIEGKPAFDLHPSMEVTRQAMLGGYSRQKPEPGKATNDDPMKDGFFEHIIDATGFIFLGVYGVAGNMSASRFQDARSAMKRRAATYR